MFGITNILVTHLEGVDLNLLKAVRKAVPEIELVAGGGVRDADDLEQLAGAGCDASVPGAGTAGSVARSIWRIEYTLSHLIAAEREEAAAVPRPDRGASQRR